ncbi:hypothetical protein MPSEU_000178500 [Mayamaea pseudoterrestris]|nr:hypothetical protein MPSEU_000178500 [Mayamaea pseudoterrestris]
MSKVAPIDKQELYNTDKAASNDQVVVSTMSMFDQNSPSAARRLMRLRRRLFLEAVATPYVPQSRSFAERSYSQDSTSTMDTSVGSALTMDEEEEE